MNHRIAMVIATAALALGAAACGDDGGSGTSGAKAKSGSDRTRVHIPNRQAEPAETQEKALTLGERAVAPFVDYGARDEPTKVAVRVLDVRRGAISDLKHFNLDSKQRKAVPYYIDAKFENLGRFALSPHLLRPSVEDAEGREHRPATLIVLGGTFKPCPQRRDGKVAPRESLTSCSAVLLPRGAKLDRVRFQGDVTEDPLFWRAS